MQSSSEIITTNKPTTSFLQAGCPSCRPTNSVKAVNGKISHSMDLLTPSSPGGLPTLSLTTNSSWLPWGGIAMPLISPLMPVPMSVTGTVEQNYTRQVFSLIVFFMMFDFIYYSCFTIVNIVFRYIRVLYVQ